MEGLGGVGKFLAGTVSETGATGEGGAEGHLIDPILEWATNA